MKFQSFCSRKEENTTIQQPGIENLKQVESSQGPFQTENVFHLWNNPRMSYVL